MVEHRRTKASQAKSSTPRAGRQTELTLENLKQRAAVAGVGLDENRLELTLQTVNAALRPLRSMEWREKRGLEPSVRFQVD